MACDITYNRHNHEHSKLMEIYTAAGYHGWGGRVSLCWLGVVVGDGNSNADSTTEAKKGFADGGRVPCKLAVFDLLAGRVGRHRLEP